MTDPDPIPDYFSLAENAFLALVKEHIENKEIYFDNPDEQVVASDDSVLGEGHDYFLITFPGAFPTEAMGTDVLEVNWSLRVEMYVRFSTIPETWANFKAFRSDLFNLLNVRRIGRNLNRANAVRTVLLSGNTEPIFYGEEDTPNDPVFFSQQLSLSIYFKINRT